MQRKFALEYLKDLNGSKAAIRAGYSEKTSRQEAVRLLKNEQIKTFIRSAIEDQESRVKVDSDRVVKELARIAFFDPTCMVRLASEDLDIEDLPADERAAISEFTIHETEFVSKDGETTIKRTIKVKAHSKTKALDTLAQHFQLFDTPPDDTPEEYSRPESMKEEE